jgi:hypothetical protein
MRPTRNGGFIDMAYPKTGAFILVLAAVPLLSACAPKVSSLDCAEIVTEATKISQSQTAKLQTVTNVRETSRTETDARCEGDATMSDGATGTVYLRAYEENGNTIVAYQGMPFP